MARTRDEGPPADSMSGAFRQAVGRAAYTVEARIRDYVRP